MKREIEEIVLEAFEELIEKVEGLELSTTEVLDVVELLISELETYGVEVEERGEI